MVLWLFFLIICKSSFLVGHHLVYFSKNQSTYVFYSVILNFLVYLLTNYGYFWKFYCNLFFHLKKSYILIIHNIAFKPKSDELIISCHIISDIQHLSALFNSYYPYSTAINPNGQLSARSDSYYVYPTVNLFLSNVEINAKSLNYM